MILNFLKRVFGKEETAAAPAAMPVAAPAAAPRPVEKPAAGAEKPVGGGVEVASLSLRAILEKLPQELRAIVNQMPEPSVKIMLPVNTIMKQLPGGAVRMSLASLLRQAPQGTFLKTAVEEKQMVDVPLAEVFKNVDASRLGRRSDQRRYEVPDEITGLFGRAGGDRTVNGGAAPADVAPTEAVAPSAPEPQPEPARVIRMPGIAPGSAGVTNGTGHAAPAPAPTPAPAPKRPLAAPASCDGELILSFVELAAGWPEGIRSALSLVQGDTKFVIPASAVGPGLQKGKVAFPWSQVRIWMRPMPQGTTAIPEDFELVFPLKIVAPAFVAATGASKRREAAEIDHSLPDFFGPAAGKQAAPAPSAPEITPVAESAAPALVPPTVVAEPETAHAPAPLKFTLVREEPTPVAEITPAPSVSSPVAAAPVAPHAVSAATPAEIVKQACALPGVAGALVALEEGLVVAQNLPDGFAADTFAAFMPQIFGRLEKYTSEMQIGTAAAITIHSEHGPCHIARSGKIYFGALGRNGGPLPASLESLTAQLAALNS